MPGPGEPDIQNGPFLGFGRIDTPQRIKSDYTPSRIEQQNARLRCTLAERGLAGAFRAGHSAALGIALCALTGDEFTRARQLITDAILKEVDSLGAHP